MDIHFVSRMLCCIAIAPTRFVALKLMHCMVVHERDACEDGPYLIIVYARHMHASDVHNHSVQASVRDVVNDWHLTHIQTPLASLHNV